MGVEPVEGQYNETYLDVIEDIINQAGVYGIYTLIDMHQDLFSEKFCGDGMPMWLPKYEQYKDFAAPIKNITFDNTSGYP